MGMDKNINSKCQGEVKEIDNLKEAIDIYYEIVESEEKHGKLFYTGKIDEQAWVDTVYRVMDFPSYDVNWNEISMSSELKKEFWEWEFNRRKKLPASKSWF